MKNFFADQKQYAFTFVFRSYPGTTQWLRGPGLDRQPFAE